MSRMILDSRNYSDVTLRPFTYIAPSIRTSALVMIFVLIPQLLMLALTKSFSSLLIIAATVVGSILADFVYSRINRQNAINFVTAIVQGILIGMFIPSTYNILVIFIVTFSTVFFTKYAFGGFAGSWANPMAVTVAVAYLLSSACFPKYGVTMQDLSTRNAALSLIQNGSIPILANDYKATAFFNNMIFRLFKVSIPEGYMTLLWDTGSIIPAFRFNVLTMLGSIVVFAFDIIDGIIPIVFLAVYAILVKIFGPFVAGQHLFQGDMLLAIFTSGTLFGATFMLNWYGTTPVTKRGKILFGVIAGIIGFLIMGVGTSSAGMIFVVLIMNVVSTVIQIYESAQVRKQIEGGLSSRIKEMKEVENV